MSYFNYKRRVTSVTHIGNLPMGGKYPIRIQSMTSTNTNDTDASVDQILKIANAGGEYVRLTAQGVREGENLKNIHALVRAKGYTTPLIADIHFNPRAAEAAAQYVEKVRINPGNYVDRVKTFAVFDYTDEEYAEEIDKIRARFTPLLALCKERKVALRIGVNHGSLSDRIMSRYGDTPEGMVESCMEFLNICVEENFSDVVISMKTSNPVIMTHAVRLLIERMDAVGLSFPLHLGVTEAGDGEDGRIKSAVGIGALLSDGIGDTIRVSLSEDPEKEIPVARKIVDYVVSREGHQEIKGEMDKRFSFYSTDRRVTHEVKNIGGRNQPIVISDRSSGNFRFDVHFLPDYIYVGKDLPAEAPLAKPVIIDVDGWKGQENTYSYFRVKDLKELEQNEAKLKFVELSYPDLSNAVLEQLKKDETIVIVLTTNHVNGVGEQRAFLHTLQNEEIKTPVILKRVYQEKEAEDLQIKAGIDLGTVLLDGFGEGLFIQNVGQIAQSEIDSCSFGILQASRLRTSKTEYISCPSCGRTLFDLQTTVAEVKAATSHLTHLKIGIMGCIVNGPGEMADADYGYVGAEKGKISLYKKKECIQKNIPASEAVSRLVEIIKQHGDWVDPSGE